MRRLKLQVLQAQITLQAIQALQAQMTLLQALQVQITLQAQKQKELARAVLFSQGQKLLLLEKEKTEAKAVEV